jgi:hypothetical protein
MLRSEEAHGSGELNAEVAAIAHNTVSVAIMISRSVTGDGDSVTPECICILLGVNATQRRQHPRECPLTGQLQAVQRLERDPVLLYLGSLVSPVWIL